MFLFLVTPYFVLAVKSFQFESDKDVIEDDADDGMSDIDDDMSANDNLSDAN